MTKSRTLAPNRQPARKLAALRRKMLEVSSAEKADRTLLALLLLNFIYANYPAIKLCLPLADAPDQISASDILRSFELLDRYFHSKFGAYLERDTLDALQPQILEEIQQLASILNLHSLCFLSEKLLAGSNANRDGVFYTPHSVVHEITSDSLRQAFDQGPRPTVLDPACGSGVFLIEALQQLFARDPSRCRAEILTTQIFGVDKSAPAVELSKVLLLLTLLQSEQLDLFALEDLPDLSSNIKVGNSLLDPEQIGVFDKKSSDRMEGFNWKSSFPEVMNAGGFDCIIGNPPYGLSRDQQLSAEENEVLKNTFQDFRSGKVNKYLAFMARGYQLLNQGGALSFIVPNAWLGIEAGSAIRSLLLNNQALRRLVVFDCSVFEEPSLEAVIFSVSKASKHSQIEVYRCNDLEHIPGKLTLSIPSSAVLESPGCKISTLWSESGSGLLRHINSVSMTLGAAQSFFTPMIALQAYAKGRGVPPQSELAAKERIFHSTEKLDQSYVPYLEGADISSYCLSWSGQYLKYGRWLAEPQSLERFSGPRILLREITSPTPYLLSACLVTEPFLYNKSILHILTSEPNRERELWALLAVLNSKLASYVMLQCGRKTQRRIFPKIVNADLKDFPLSLAILDQPQKLASIAMQLSVEEGRNQALRAEIDRQVFTAYQLKNSQVQEIEAALKDG